jgi:nitroimidazol reductase NimA-like FMN-containing flavoprotein (pyridoxamine 5'-phosphate oxidase superfamily)
MNVQPISATECFAALTAAGVGRLACARDNQPYVVPIYFVVDGDELYAFSLPGQKIDWMRENPQVCLEVDWVNRGDDWSSVVVVGRYEELTDTPDHYNQRLRALALLQSRQMAWEPGASSGPDSAKPLAYAPIFYRIVVDQVTGFRGVPSAEQVSPSDSSKRTAAL